MVVRYKQLVAVAVLVVSLWATPARADLFGNVVLGLDAAGFNVTGAPNPLSGGRITQIDRTFVGETLNFGATELQLLGPISVSFGHGGRAIQTFDLSFSTLGQPFQYIYSADTGGQETLISGSFAMDGDFSINSFGFYDLTLFFSSRQDITTEGRFSNVDGEEQDFDLGPVDISGNIFADVLAALLDPVFEAAGAQNIFASFSSRGGLDQSLFSAIQGLPANAGGGLALPSGAADSVNVGQGGGTIPEFAFVGVGYDPATGLTAAGNTAPIPEPATACLLLGGLGAIAAHRRLRGRKATV
ncbi:MAG: PEP-CTERM sorting domain-containing protein [Planctomycetes bacterium]|nr:PEP-CTERM sorting domain-containing protein [Planctomycetota bacterium]